MRGCVRKERGESSVHATVVPGVAKVGDDRG